MPNYLNKFSQLGYRGKKLSRNYALESKIMDFFYNFQLLQQNALIAQQQVS
jgi:hypothetical protein